MGKKTDRAFEAMRESNRLYLEDRKKKETDTAGKNAGEEYDPSLAPEEIEELKRAEEKARAFHAQSDGPETDDVEEGERKAQEFHEEDDGKLEKGDVPALILSALLVFGPVFLVFIALIVLVWVFLHP